MRIRVGFVSNSSTSSYVCEICERSEVISSDDDFGMLLNYGFKQCSVGHVFCDKHTTWRESPYSFVPDVVHEASGLPMPVAMNVLNYLVKPGREAEFTEEVYASDTENEEEEDKAKTKRKKKTAAAEREEEEKEKEAEDEKEQLRNEGYWEWRERKGYGRMSQDALRAREWEYDKYGISKNRYPESSCPVCNCSVSHPWNMIRFLVEQRGLDEQELLEAMRKERAKHESFHEFVLAALLPRRPRPSAL